MWRSRLAVVGMFLCLAAGARGQEGDRIAPGGELRMIAPEGGFVGACPLKYTDVDIQVTGFIARAHVRQTFHNPLDRKIEAVYVFPLPAGAAVDEMTITVGERRIVGKIKEREEAREIYERAKAAGHVAGLLDQERPNIFTQSVANIEPGVEIVVEIGYVETLKWEDGWYELAFPTVVGPRYMPGAPIGAQGTGWAPDTTQVPDASRISPPVTPPGTRTGQDISLIVQIDAGMDVKEIKSELHDIDVTESGPGRATVTLKQLTEIPNRDFILRYRTSTDKIEDAFLVHRDSRGAFFTLILQPPRRVAPEAARPKEMIFVIDRSGSMSGFPIEKAKATMRRCIEQMNPRDTFDLMSFSGGTGTCFGRPVPNTSENREIALKYLQDLYGSGGTEMMTAIMTALGGPRDPERVRIVCFMTDGFIGNDMEIIEAVQRNAGTARVFAFGIGNSVNRFLLDGMARAGRGEVEYVTIEGQGDKAAARFQERIQSPVLTDIGIDWGGLDVREVFPKQYPDLFSAKPILIHGRLDGPAEGEIQLTGLTGIGPYMDRIKVKGPEEANNEALASLWARAKVGDIMSRAYTAVQRNAPPPELKAEIVKLGLEYRLMTQYTSFVAVDESAVTSGGPGVTVPVPVEMPSGVSYEGVFGAPPPMVAGARGIASGDFFAMKNGPAASANPEAAGQRAAGPGDALRLGTVDREAGRQSNAAATGPARAIAAEATGKLAEPLRGLAEKVAKEGREGSLTAGKLKVSGWKIEVMVYLRDALDKTAKALGDLGFAQTGKRQRGRLVIGTIDVRKLEELAKLEAVVRVMPKE